MTKKATGIVKKIDCLGRVYIPAEICTHTGINKPDLVEIYTDTGGEIVLKRHEPTCVFCGLTAELNVYRGKNVCKGCINDISEIAFEGG